MNKKNSVNQRVAKLVYVIPMAAGAFIFIAFKNFENK